MKKFSLYIALTLAVSACVYPYTPELEDTAEPSLVIDANILIGNTSTVNLSYLQPLEVGQRNAGSGRPSGVVYLEDNAGHTYQAENRFGTYVIPPFQPSGSSEYRLTVMADGNTYRSEWITPTEPPTITDVTFSASETQVFVNVSLKEEGSGSGYAAASYEEIWKFHSDFMRMYMYNPESNSVIALMAPDETVYWCWKKSSTGRQVSIDYSSLNGEVNAFPVYGFLKTDNRNHDEYDVRIKVWNLTPEQYKYRKMLEDNESIGGNLFSPEPGEVRGNVFCENDETIKVYGYVNISRVAVKDAVFHSIYDRWTAPKSLIEVDPEDYLKMYENGYSPVETVLGDEGHSFIGWGQGRCYDCTQAGGTLEKPSFD